MQLAKATTGRGKVLRNQLWIPIPELNPSLSVKLTAAGPLLMQLQRSNSASFGAVSSNSTNWRSSFNQQPWGSDLCHAQRSHTPQEIFLRWSQWQMVILQIRRQRGGLRLGCNLTQLAGHWGLCTALPDNDQHYIASICCREDPLLGPLWSDGLLTRRCCDAVSLRWPARKNPRDDGETIARWSQSMTKTPHTLTPIFMQWPRLGDPKFCPRARRLKLEHGLCRLRVKAQVSSIILMINFNICGD